MGNSWRNGFIFNSWNVQEQRQVFVFVLFCFVWSANRDVLVHVEIIVIRNIIIVIIIITILLFMIIFAWAGLAF